MVFSGHRFNPPPRQHFDFVSAIILIRKNLIYNLEQIV